MSDNSRVFKDLTKFREEFFNFAKLLSACPDYLPRLREWMENTAAIKGEREVVLAVHCAFVITGQFKLAKILRKVAPPVGEVAEANLDSLTYLIFAATDVNHELLESAIKFLEDDGKDIADKFLKGMQR